MINIKHDCSWSVIGNIEIGCLDAALGALNGCVQFTHIWLNENKDKVKNNTVNDILPTTITLLKSCMCYSDLFNQ